MGHPRVQTTGLCTDMRASNLSVLMSCLASETTHLGYSGSKLQYSQQVYGRSFLHPEIKCVIYSSFTRDSKDCTKLNSRFGQRLTVQVEIPELGWKSFLITTLFPLVYVGDFFYLLRQDFCIFSYFYFVDVIELVACTMYWYVMYRIHININYIDSQNY